MYTQIDPADEEAVIWLQRSLSKLMHPRTFNVHLGRFDPLMGKMLEFYQGLNGLPRTGKADEATLQHIQQALELKP